MINFLAIAIVFALIGFFERDGREKIKELYKRTNKPEPVVGATRASYAPVNQYAANQDGEIGISEPKTPQLLEWEAKQELEAMQHNVQVKPR